MKDIKSFCNINTSLGTLGSAPELVRQRGLVIMSQYTSINLLTLGKRGRVFVCGLLLF